MGTCLRTDVDVEGLIICLRHSDRPSQCTAETILKSVLQVYHACEAYNRVVVFRIIDELVSYNGRCHGNGSCFLFVGKNRKSSRGVCLTWICQDLHIVSPADRVQRGCLSPEVAFEAIVRVTAWVPCGSSACGSEQHIKFREGFRAVVAGSDK